MQNYPVIRKSTEEFINKTEIREYNVLISATPTLDELETIHENQKKLSENYIHLKATTIESKKSIVASKGDLEPHYKLKEVKDFIKIY